VLHEEMMAGSGRLRSVAAVVGMSVLLATGVAACGSEESSSDGGGGASSKGKVIGVSVKNQLQRRWAFDLKGIQAQAKKNGDTVLVEYANDDPARQASQVENLLSRGIDSLIITPVDDRAAAQAANAAKAEKVPVISYDIGVRDAPTDFFVERDNLQAGKLQIEEALKVAPSGNYAFFRGDSGTGVVKTISGEWDKAIKGKPGVKLVFEQFIDGFDANTAQSRAEDVLSSNKDDVAAFLSLNDGMAVGIAQAIAGRKLTGKVFLSGLDADPANLRMIANGSQTMSVWTPLDEQAKVAADAAHALMNGEKPESQTTTDLGAGDVPTALIPSVAITKDNLCEYLDGGFPAGWADKAEVLKDDPTLCD
jgi:D-xylose transport system substrate-binding protein